MVRIFANPQSADYARWDRKFYIGVKGA